MLNPVFPYILNGKKNLTSLISSSIVLMMVHWNQNAIVSTSLLNKFLLLLRLPRYQLFFTYCRITLHYLLQGMSNIWSVNTFCRYIQLKVQTVLFLTILFNVCHLFAHSLNVKEFYLTYLVLSLCWEWTWQQWQWNGIPHSPKLYRLILYPGHSVRWCLIPLQRCSRCILVP